MDVGEQVLSNSRTQNSLGSNNLQPHYQEDESNRSQVPSIVRGKPLAGVKTVYVSVCTRVSE